MSVDIPAEMLSINSITQSYLNEGNSTVAVDDVV